MRVNIMDTKTDYKKILSYQGKVTLKFCIRCQRIKKIYAKNLCRYCYNYSKYSDKYKKYNEKWREKNPNYFKEYYKKRNKDGK